jgi:hypothetical protein
MHAIPRFEVLALDRLDLISAAAVAALWACTTHGWFSAQLAQYAHGGKSRAVVAVVPLGHDGDARIDDPDAAVDVSANALFQLVLNLHTASRQVAQAFLCFVEFPLRSIGFSVQFEKANRSLFQLVFV